jgi:hypothetical protein
VAYFSPQNLSSRNPLRRRWSGRRDSGQPGFRRSRYCEPCPVRIVFEIGMTEKPQALQELENAASKMAEAKETIRLAKVQIKESLSKLGGQVLAEDHRLSIAKHLLDEYGGVCGINKHSVARTVLNCSWVEMERRMGPTVRNCSETGQSRITHNFLPPRQPDRHRPRRHPAQIMVQSPSLFLRLNHAP